MLGCDVEPSSRTTQASGARSTSCTLGDPAPRVVVGRHQARIELTDESHLACPTDKSLERSVILMEAWPSSPRSAVRSRRRGNSPGSCSPVVLRNADHRPRTSRYPVDSVQGTSSTSSADQESLDERHDPARPRAVLPVLW